MQELGTFLLSQMSGNKRVRLEDEFSVSGLTPDDYATDIARILREVKSINKKKFSRHVFRLMNEKFSSLRYPGKSEIEKNILALKKMFSLSEREAELCSFFFIVDLRIRILYSAFNIAGFYSFHRVNPFIFVNTLPEEFHEKRS